MKTSLDGLKYLLSLSYVAIDKSSLNENEKRNLAYSAYNFGLVYDSGEMTDPHDLLFKLGVCFSIDKNSHPDYAQKTDYFDNMVEEPTFVEGGGVFVNGKIKFDVCGNLWQRCIKLGIIIGDAAQKLSLYTLVHKLLTLDSATEELIAMWYIFFPFVVNMGAPYEDEPFMELKGIVLNENIFKRALELPYSDMIPINTKEMVLGGTNPILIDWFIEYTEWKNVKNDKGITRETEKYQRALIMGDYEYAVRGTDRLLDVNPDDEELFLLNMAAKVSYAGTLDDKKRERLFDDIIIAAQEALPLPRFKKKNYVAYNLGLAFLGQNQIEKAKNSFKLSLTYDPKFELSELMLKGIQKLEDNSTKS